MYSIYAADLFFICTGIGFLGAHLTQVHLTKVNDTSAQQQFNGGYLEYTKQSCDLREGEDIGERLLIYPQLEGNYTCGLWQGDGPLNFNITLSSVLPALDQHYQLQAELLVNFSHIPRIPNTEDCRNASTTYAIDISDGINSHRTGGKSILLQVNRAAVSE